MAAALNLIRRRPIAVFVILTFFITYVAGLPWALLSGGLEASLGLREEFLSLALMRAGPTVAGLSVVALISGRKGLAIWLRQLVRWRVPLVFYLAIGAIVMVPFAGGLALLFGFDVLASSPELAATREWPAIAWSYLQEIAYITLTNGEETGWRFALMGLLLAHMRVLPAVLIVGVIWAFWHMPAFFLFGQGALWFPIVPICLSWAILYGWLYLRTQSLLLPILAHGMANATFYTFERHFPALSASYDALEPLGDWMFAAVGVALALVVLILDRRLFLNAFPTSPSENWAEDKRRVLYVDEQGR